MMKNDGWYLLTTLVMMPPMNFQLMKLLSFLMLMTAGLYPGGMQPFISSLGSKHVFGGVHTNRR